LRDLLSYLPLSVYSGGKTSWRKTGGETFSGSNGSMFATPYTSHTEVRVGVAGKEVVHSERVVYNAPTQRVRFNGASVQLEAVPLPAKNQRTTVTGASGFARPPAPPKVSVSTASGTPLLPPPRLRKGDETSVEVGGRMDSAVGHHGVVDVEDPAESGLEDIQQLAEVVASGLQLEERGEERGHAASSVVGSFQMSDDGNAMLFSTG
jgi:hypothetical protein